MKSFPDILLELRNQKELERQITRRELADLEKVLDRLFSDLNIDVEFTKHFFDRVNDERNKRQITVQELMTIFMDVHTKHGKSLSKYHGDVEKLIKSVTTGINIPVAIEWNRDKHQIELVTKTVMRKKGFKSPDPVLRVENEGG